MKGNWNAGARRNVTRGFCGRGALQGGRRHWGHGATQGAPRSSRQLAVVAAMANCHSHAAQPPHHAPPLSCSGPSFRSLAVTLTCSIAWSKAFTESPFRRARTTTGAWACNSQRGARTPGRCCSANPSFPPCLRDGKRPLDLHNRSSCTGSQ